MPGDSLLLLFALLFIAAAAGAWTALRLTKHRHTTSPGQHPLSPDYFEGLNFLLNEQPDKALEVFIRMAEVDNETVETHFALGNLFRRRGEVERAIRIHQNIIARPNLAKKQRDQALFALAKDYLKAGLFDRAEKLLQQLTGVPGQRRNAMRGLVSIYEQQKDWAQVIDVRRKLGELSSADERGVAHAYCELAQQAIDKGDHAGARNYLKKAKVNGVKLVRSALMRTAIADQQQDLKTAVKLCRSVVESDSSFAIEILPVLLRNLRLAGGPDNVSKVLSAMTKKQPELGSPLAIAAITHSEYENPVIQNCLIEFFRQDPFACHLARLSSDSESADCTGLSSENVVELCKILEELVRRRARYDCRECGYSGNVLYWQCPSCKAWDSTRPVIELIRGPHSAFA